MCHNHGEVNAMRSKGTGSVVKLYGKKGTINAVTGKRPESKYWYILYYANGRQVRESSKTESKMKAEALLQRRIGETSLGVRPEQDVKSIKFENVRDALVNEYINQNRGTVWTKTDGTKYVDGVQHLTKFFKGRSVTKITTEEIRRFIEARRKEGAADATIRRNLNLLRSMLNMARKEGKLRLQDVPHFPMPKDSQPAGQYLDPGMFAKLLAQLPKSLRPFFTFQYHTGCRLGAAQAITWDMVIKNASEIKIPGELMKAHAPLTIVLAGKGLEPVAAMLKKMFRRADARVFDVTNFRSEWQKACHKAGLGVRLVKWENKRNLRTYTGLRIHDLRCSAAINLVDAGVPEDIVMKIGGWKTRSMFSRYNVVNSDRIRKAMEKGGEYVARRANESL
jgi:integrase